MTGAGSHLIISSQPKCEPRTSAYLLTRRKGFKKEQSVWCTTSTRTVSDVSQLGKVVATHQFTRADIQLLCRPIPPLRKRFRCVTPETPALPPLLCRMDAIKTFFDAPLTDLTLPQHGTHRSFTIRPTQPEKPVAFRGCRPAGE